MRVLIDECLDERIRHSFLEHDCQTAHYAKLAGLTNGELLAAAESLGLEVPVTVDQSIPYQQRLVGRRIAVLILCAPTNRLRDLQPLVRRALAALGVPNRLPMPSDFVFCRLRPLF
jgi:hypothetical protein